MSKLRTLLMLGMAGACFGPVDRAGGAGRFGMTGVTFAPSDEAGEPMGIIELDEELSSIEKPPELPVGSYVGEIQDIQVQTSGKGNQYFAIKFVISPEEIAPDIQEHYEEGAVLYWNRQIVPTGKDRRALFNLRKFVEALGLSSDTKEIDPNEWMGQKAKLRVVHGKFNGDVRAEIKAVEPAEKAAPKASTARGSRGKK